MRRRLSTKLTPQTLEFIVPGSAQTKGSTRMVPTAYSGTRIISANPKLKDWEEDVAWAAQEAMLKGHIGQFSGAVRVIATFFLPRPKSVPLSVRYHVRRLDLDKLLRAINDAMTGIVYVDDQQVVDLVGYKRYALTAPHVSISVAQLVEP